MEDNIYGIKTYLSVLEKGLKYIEKRRDGDIKSLRTPWPGFNEAGIAGLEWGTMLTIGARPGSGKTMLTSQIIREAYRLNPNQEFNILEFQFEMGDDQYAARQFAAETAKDYKVILSANYRLDDFIYDHCKRYIEEVRKLKDLGIRRDMLSTPLTSVQMEDAIKKVYVRGGNKPLIVTIDHSWLIKKGTADKDKFDALYNTTEMLMQLKNQIPIIVLMVTQLNRNIDEAARKNPGTIANYPTSSDIFGGDALQQGSDMVIVLSRPKDAGINIYGPENYIAGEDDVFMHLLKVRNGANKKKMLFLNMDGANQRMVEVQEFQRQAAGYVRRYNGNNRQQDVSAPIGGEL